LSALKLTVTNWGEVALDKREMKNLMRSAAGDIKSKTARLISQTTGSGRTYRGGGGSAYRGTYRAGSYRASAAGDPPVMVSGTLRQSLKAYPYPSGEGFAVRERAFYALFLEAGATGGGNPGGGRSGQQRRAQARRYRARSVFTARVLAPRPHLDRVMEQEEPNLERRVRQALTDGLKWRETTKP
jgi:hypothetical protein